jgi:hypothetical protein
VTNQHVLDSDETILPAVRPPMNLIPQLPDEGDYGIPDEELRPPFLLWNGKLGTFTNTITGEVTESVRLVLLRRLPATRILWNKDLDAQQKILCRSADMVYPTDADQAARIGAGPTCEGCRLAEFPVDQNGKTSKSPCSEYLNIAVVLADDDLPLPFLFAAKSTSLRPLRNTLGQLAYLRKAAKVRGIPGYALVFQLSKGSMAGEGARKYFPLKGELVTDRIPEDRWPELSAIWQTVKAAVIDVTPEPDEELEAASGAGDDGPRVMDGAELIRQMDEEAPHRATRAAATAAQPHAAAMPETMAIPVKEPASGDVPQDWDGWERELGPSRRDPVDGVKGKGRR